MKLLGNYKTNVNRQTKCIFSSLPQSKRSFVVKLILCYCFYYPLVILLFLLIKDENQYERFRQNLIKKLNKLHLDPYLGLVKPSKDGIFWDGCNISGDTSTSLIYTIYINKFYLKPNHNDIVIDVGAHIGIYSIYASKYAKRVIAIEPEPNNFNHLVKNVSAKSNIYPLNIALGDLNGKQRLYLHASLGHSLLFTSNKYVEVSVKKLDGLIEELKLDKVDLIKINAEGYELQILKCAEKILKKFKPSLIIGTHHYEKEIEQIIDLFEKLDLKEHYTMHEGGGTLIMKRKYNNS